MRIRISLLATAAAGLFGCGQHESTPSPVVFEQEISAEAATKVEVRLVGKFHDDLAYQDERGVYRIIDHETGKQYLGVSGIGIVEVGEHKEGSGDSQRTVEDER
jgi:hypothetical protein